jgi:hypothetical protein
MADQCAWMTHEQAQRATNMLNSSKRMAELCEPCGQHRPVVWDFSRAEMVQASDKAHWEVELHSLTAVGQSGKVDRRMVDAAYIYVGKDSEWSNLAFLAACPTTGVREKIPEPVDARGAPPPGSSDKKEEKKGGKDKSKGKKGGKG